MNFSSGSRIWKKAARRVLEEQRDRQLAEAKSEILKQECKVKTLTTCSRDFQRHTNSHRLHMDGVNCGYEESRREQPDFTKNWLNKKKHFKILASEISMSGRIQESSGCAN